MKVEWKLKNSHRNGYKMYLCKRKKEVGYNKYLIEGQLIVAVNGRNTAFVKFYQWCLNYTNMRFGFSLSNHFDGHNASHKARAWFRFMVKNMPYNFQELREDFKDV